jgi:phosphonate transport system permease protein
VLPPPVEVAEPVPVEIPRGRLLLEASDCCVRYQRGADHTVKGATLRVYEGDRVALLGPSGCGKTTFLRALEGSLDACCGRIERHGFAVLIYQDLRLVSELSVLRNVCAGAYKRLGAVGGVWRFPREVRERAMELLRDLGLAELAHRRVGSLSGGQRQRVAIARALCSNPAVLLADEPLAALDPDNAERTLQLLDRLQRKYGFAIVASTHNREVVSSFFDRAYRLDGGELREVEVGKVPQEQNGFMGDEGFGRLEPCEGCELRETVGCGEMAVAQDKGSGEVPGWWRVARGPVVLVGVVGVLAWAVSALKLGSTDLGGAMTGLQMFVRNVVPGSWAEVWALPWGTLFWALVEMIQMAIVGTMLGLVMSMPLSVLAARDTSPGPVRHAVRLLLNAIRTIPSIIWGLLFVAIVGMQDVRGIQSRNLC